MGGKYPVSLDSFAADSLSSTDAQSNSDLRVKILQKKDKLIASAQKSLQKGQIAKAIKDYEKVLGLAPDDVRNRQKLAELYNRSGNARQGIEEFEKVGKYYTDNGFYLKAIAVFKQIQKIDPTKVEVYHRLAELNCKQGLIGNALAEYRSLVVYYEKKHDTEEIVGVLQKMKEIDPENLNIRVKLAEVYGLMEMKDEALEDFQEVLAVLQEKGQGAKILKLHEIFYNLFPDEPAIIAGLGEALITQGETDKGIALLQELLQADPSHGGALRSLALGYHQRGDYEEEFQILESLLEETPGDLSLRQKQILSCLDGKSHQKALDLLEEHKSSFLEADQLGALKLYYEQLREQLPDEERVVASLHTIYEATGEGGKLFDVLSSGESEEEPAPAEATSLVEDGASPPESGDEADIDMPEDVAADLASVVESQGDSESLEEPEEEMSLSFLEETAETDEQNAAPEDENVELDLDLDLDFDLDEDLEELSLTEVEIEGVAEVQEADLSADEDLEKITASAGSAPGDGEGGDLDLALDVEEEASQPVACSPAEIESSLEEATFYVQQGLFDEAEAICGKLLESAPEASAVSEMLEQIRGLRSESAGKDSGEGFFDLASEVLDEIDIPQSESTSSRNDRFGLEGEFSKFKKGVEAQIDSDDAEAHYNLGIAYKEMGLIGDAIAEFDHAMRDPARTVDCLTLKGMCFVEKGEFESAEETLKYGFESEGLSEVQRISLSFELGLLYEAWGRPLDALEEYRNVADSDMFFRNVGERIEALKAQLGLDDPEDDNDSSAGDKKNRVSYV